MLLTQIATVAVLLALSFAPAVARVEFVALVPNGANVPSVEAIGHARGDGGAALNKFGKDFESAGRKWTAALCAKDSDGDGQTNGQELGDPCCAFVAGSNAKVLWKTGVSHPGDASKTSDPTLWASVSCSGGSASNGNGTSSSSATATSAPASTPAPASGAGVLATALQAATALVIGGAVIALA